MRGYAKEDDHASNDTPARTFAEVLAQVATERSTLENVKDPTVVRLRSIRSLTTQLRDSIRHRPRNDGDWMIPK